MYCKRKLLRLEPTALNDTGPNAGIGCLSGRQLRRIHITHSKTQGRQLRVNVTLFKHIADGGRETIHKRLWHTLGRKDAVVRQLFKTLDALLQQRGHIGHRCLTLGTQHADHAHLAGLVVLHEIGHRCDACRNLITQHVPQQRSAAAVRSSHQIELVVISQNFDQELWRRSRCRNTDCAALGVGLDPCHVLGQILGWRVAGKPPAHSQTWQCLPRG